MLLVEDETEVRELIADAFADRRLQVIEADRDTAALSLLEARARDFAVLVTDINLGAGVTGFDIARRGRQLNPELKVIYINGQAAHLSKFGVEDAVMFPKPFEPRELADRVAELLSAG